MDLKKVEELLKPYLDENGFELFDIEIVKEFGYLILRVSIDKPEGIEIDELAMCNEYLSERIDSIDSDMPEYMLEVCSPGAEKPLRNIDEIKKNIGKYVHVEVPGMIYEGSLEDMIDNQVVIRYNAKGRFKIAKLSYDEIKLIRLAVKI